MISIILALSKVRNVRFVNNWACAEYVGTAGGENVSFFRALCSSKIGGGEYGFARRCRRAAWRRGGGGCI